MDIKKHFEFISIILFLALLASCSQTGTSLFSSQNKGKNYAEVTTAGAEVDSDIDVDDNSTKYKAPFDQVYYFAFDSYDVASDDASSITVQANYIKDHPNSKVFLAGHADERGSPEYNIALGEKRAKAVLDLLLSHGVKKGQVRMVSYGAEKPSAKGSNEDVYKLNRRVEFSYEEVA